jgi:Fe-S-cluster containining protein
MPELQSLIDELVRLFQKMDAAYDRIATAYGFQCRGCEENCCRSLFYHHTQIEQLLLQQGLRRLDAKTASRVRGRASEIIHCRDAAAEKPMARIWCPLNEAERCLLYNHRPMICRLHGIPHILNRPDGRGQVGAGCADFVSRCGTRSDERLDRTPLYGHLADLERRTRQATGFIGKIRLTIAEMILKDKLQ